MNEELGEMKLGEMELGMMLLAGIDFHENYLSNVTSGAYKE